MRINTYLIAALSTTTLLLTITVPLEAREGTVSTPVNLSSAKEVKIAEEAKLGPNGIATSITKTAPTIFDMQDVETKTELKEFKLPLMYQRGANIEKVSGFSEIKHFMYQGYYIGKSISFDYDDVHFSADKEKMIQIKIHSIKWFGAKGNVLSFYQDENYTTFIRSSTVDNKADYVKTKFVDHEYSEAQNDLQNRIVSEKRITELNYSQKSNGHLFVNQDIFSYELSEGTMKDQKVKDYYKRETLFDDQGIQKELKIFRNEKLEYQVNYESNDLKYAYANFGLGDVTQFKYFDTDQNAISDAIEIKSDGLSLFDFVKLTTKYNEYINHERVLKLANVHQSSFPTLSFHYLKK